MEVTGVGANAPGPGVSAPGMNLPGTARGVPAPNAPAVPSTDTVATLLREAAGADLAQLAEMLQQPPAPAIAAQAEALFRDAVSAAAAGDVAKALGHLAVLAPLDPQRAEVLSSEAGMAPIRAAVESLLARLTSAARLDAGSRLEQARSLLPLIESNRFEAAVLLAARLLDTGGYANAVHSSQLSQMAIDQVRWAPAQTPVPPPEFEPRAGLGGPAGESRLLSGLKRLWRRAPLAVALLAWGIVGLIGGGMVAIFRDEWPQPAVSLAVEFWVIGLLTLVVSAFYTRVRGPRR